MPCATGPVPQTSAPWPSAPQGRMVRDRPFPIADAPPPKRSPSAKRTAPSSPLKAGARSGSKSSGSCPSREGRTARNCAPRSPPQSPPSVKSRLAGATSGRQPPCAGPGQPLPAAVNRQPSQTHASPRAVAPPGSQAGPPPDRPVASTSGTSRMRRLKAPPPR